MFIFLAIGIVLLTAAAVSTYFLQRDKLATELYADDTPALERALHRAAEGAVIELSGDNYTAFRLENHHWPLQGVTVFVAKGRQVTFESIELQQVTGLRIDGITLTGRYQATASEALELSRATVGDGVYLRGGTRRVDIIDNTITGGRFGVWINSQNTPANEDIEISRNVISRQTGDNIQVGAANRLVIDDNEIRDIPDNDDHNDGIQVMGGYDITISGNRLSGQDQAILLKAEPEVLGADTSVSLVRVENNLITGERGAGVIVAGTENVDVVNNTGVGNQFADIRLEGVNRKLEVWNNAVMQIFTQDPQEPSFSFNNCAQRHSRPGPTDVLETPRFVGNEYRLLADSACAKAATTIRAPATDLEHSPRGSVPTTGALQPRS